MKRISTFFVVLTICFSAISVAAQITAESAGTQKTPFAYPVAPDTCATLESRCNYIVQNFWNNYDIAKPIANDADFETAFRDYVEFFRYAHKNIVMASVRHFIFKARSNTPNLLKVGRVAEAALYGPYAEYWSDELYVEIAKLLAESTSLKAADRNYYKHQIEVINNCVVGNKLQDIDLNTASGKIKLSSLGAKSFLLVFTDDSSSSSIDRLRLSTDVNLNALIEGGQLVVVQIFLGKPASGWAEAQPANWTNAYSEQVARMLDLRGCPVCYIVDGDLTILTKNVSADEFKKALSQ